ncbi:hypothetical protein HNQ91_001573 [Filimonas zeae]|uniref:Ricin B lectin domain-containing protein n=1 Tax=Filimonas zeae TaxID=1737353 RepID=A0A917J106_9BACT|nr:RICIN domain-containing protein [Filimonas zeae]MDR6338522.1 hypothetical protein [Filimonas zeae]GGH67837.1 hypothetical protein GCM10011379_23550 [Filimonas zeae]
MAFKPLAGQRYYLLAKHSNKAIGFKTDSLGDKLIQKTLDPTDENQKFSFDAGNNFFWIMPSYRQRYLAVNNKSREDEAAIIQWHFEPNKANHHFHFDQAGDGYYRIRVLHSDKYLDVIYASVDDGAEVKQVRLSGTDNQLFKMVPVIEDSLTPSTATLIENNDGGRSLILKCVGIIPKVGSAAAGIIAFFWTEEDKLAALWDQMKAYVDKRIHEILERKQLNDLRDQIAGLLRNVKDFDAYEKGEEKARKLTETITSAQHNLDMFVGKPNVLPYLVSYGSILLSLKYQLAVEYEDIAGKPSGAADHNTNLKLLKDMIRELSAAVKEAESSLLKNRLDLIKPVNTTLIPMSTGVIKQVEDAFDGWAMAWHYNSATEHIRKEFEALADEAVANRRKQVKNQFETELEVVTAQARLWHNFDPDAKKYVTQTVERTVGAFGGIKQTSAFASPANAVIRSITIYHENNELRGLRLTYQGGLPHTTAGKTSGNFSELILNEKADEYISGTLGYMGFVVESLWLHTNKGNRIGAGTKAGEPAGIEWPDIFPYPTFKEKAHFTGDLADGLNARLVGLSGWHNNLSIEQISFHWKYEY